MRAPLSHWLRLLWNIAPPLHLNSEIPFIAAGAIHLPPQTHWRHHAAAAAHAAAHLVYSPRNFNGDGLGPIARALAGLLEDARVEALAMRELPGLARLWRPLHTASVTTGENFETLLQRLARTLAEPAYDDPHPWVRKGRALFYGGAQDEYPALRNADDVRAAAMRLGHDIGQMRMQFNAKTYRVAPPYRDDHRWMWAADLMTVAPPPPVSSAGDRRDDDPALAPDHPVARYPEWDRLIARLRPDWCSVIEQDASALHRYSAAFDHDETVRNTALRLRRVLRAMTHRRAAKWRSDEGEVFDPGALVERQVARHRRHAPDPRVYRVAEERRARPAVCLLIDQSASTADAHGAEGLSALQTAALAAAAMANALQTAGIDCSIAGFSSNGRHAVRLQTVKSLHAPVDADMMLRLQALRPGGSTRLGAALRHATRSLVQQGSGPRWLILLSDGEAYDIDVHDPRYLLEDARHAVNAAARRGVRAVCLALAPDLSRDAQRIFGRSGVQVLRKMQDMSRALSRLLG